jgi:CHAT domain-containing protein
MKRITTLIFLYFLTVGAIAQTPNEIIKQADKLTGEQQFDKLIDLLTDNEDKIQKASPEIKIASDVLLANAYYFVNQFDKSIPLLEQYINTSLTDTTAFDVQRPLIFILSLSYFYGGYLEKADTLITNYITILEESDIKDYDYLLSLKTLCYIRWMGNNNNMEYCFKADNELLLFADSISKLPENDSIKIPYIKSVYASVLDYDKYIDNWLLFQNFVFGANLFSNLSNLSEQLRFKEVLYVAELYKDSLASIYNPDSIEYSKVLYFISNAFSRSNYTKADTALWVEPLFQKIEQNINESNPNYFFILGFCASVRNSNRQYRENLTLLKKQLEYARQNSDYIQQNSIDTIYIVNNLITAYIETNHIDSALTLMQNIDNNQDIPIEHKMNIRYGLILSLYSKSPDLYISIADKYLNDFAQNNFYDTKQMIYGICSRCFATNNYENLDYWLETYKKLPDVSLHDLEEMYDFVSTNSCVVYLDSIALKYALKSLNLCYEIGNDTLLWKGDFLKIENLGHIYGNLGDCPKEIECIKEGLKIRERITGKINEKYINQLKYLLNTHSLCFLDDNYSLQIRKELVVYVSELYGKDSDRYYDELSRLATEYRVAFKYEQALECFNSCLDYYKEKYGGKSEQYLWTKLSMAGLYADKGETQKNLEMLLAIQKDFPKSSKNYNIILDNIAGAYSDIDDNEKALKWYLDEEKVLLELKDNYNSLLGLYASIGANYTNLGDYQSAENYYKKGMDIIQTFDKRVARTMVKKIHLLYNNRAETYMEQENFKAADKVLTELESFLLKNDIKNPQVEARILEQRAYFQRNMMNLDAAFDLLIKARSLLASLPMEHNQLQIVMNNLAVTASDLGLKAEAINTYLQLREAQEKTIGTSHSLYITTLNNLMLNYIVLDSLQQAEFYLKQILQKEPNATNLNNAAMYYYKKGENKQAEKCYLSALKISKNSQERLQIILNLEYFYFQIKDFEKLPVLLKQVSESVTNKVNKFFSFLSEKQRYIYWNNSNYQLLLSYPVTAAYSTPETQSLAYDNTLFSKGLLLRSSNEIRNAVLHSGNQDLIAKFTELQSLRQQITALQSKTDSAMVAYSQSLETRADSIDKAITLASSAYRDMKTDLNMTWQEVQKHLKQNEIAIEFISFNLFDKQWTDSTMYAALLLRRDSQSPEFVPLFEESQLAALLKDENADLAKRVQKLYNGGNQRFFNGQKLYNLIWQPLETYLSGIETVYYSPAGLLNRISFAALPVDSVCLTDKYRLNLMSSTREIAHRDKKQEPLLPLRQVIEYGGIRYDVADSTLLIAQAERYKRPAEPPLLASRSLPDDATRSAGWTFLQGTETEVIEIETIIKKSKIQNIRYMGESANEESFKALSGKSPELLHIATHGFFLEDEKQIRETGFMQMLGGNKQKTYINPLLRSGLLFAGANRAWTNTDVVSGIEDGILTAEEISNLDLSRTRLAVMSACETGLGEVSNSEGVFGLQRAFKLAGVETLVMSLWKVDDAATSEFMIAFYESLLAGKTKLESFKTAQRQIREKYKNPYYWAAFVMMD